MSAGGLLLILLVMFVGMAGVLLPVIPGVILIWAAALVWALQVEGTLRWVVMVLLTLLAIVGAVAKYLVATKKMSAEGATTRTLLMGLAGAVVGFFLLPFFGLLLGGAIGVYVGEWVRLQSPSRAWWAAKRLLISLGWGILIEFGAASAMIAIWAVAAFGKLWAQG